MHVARYIYKHIDRRHVRIHPHQAVQRRTISCLYHVIHRTTHVRAMLHTQIEMSSAPNKMILSLLVLLQNHVT